MIVQEPTHLDNGLLDDSYVKKSHISTDLTFSQKNVYFSDHDTVKFQVVTRDHDTDFQITM